MSVAENIKLNEEIVASWGSGNVDRALATLADNAVWYDVSSPEPMRDKAAMRQYIQAWFTAFPGMTTRLVNQVVTEDQVATELEFTGTNSGPLQMGGGPAMPATGKTVHGKGTYFARVSNGKVIECHTYPDVAGMMMQLGMMPGA